MKNNSTKEVLVSIIIIALAVLLLNPFHFWMPDMLVYCMIAVLLIIFGTFSTFILREKDFDERDRIHKTLAGRNAFLAGSAILIIAISIEEYFESIDPWLVIALISMIVVKIGTRIWSDKNL